MTARPLALVTGPRPHLGAAAGVLARAGFNVVTWETATPAPPAGANRRSFTGILRKSNAGIGPDGPFHCYVQLPCAAAAGETRAAAGSRARPGRSGSRRAADELVVRMDTLAAVAGRLAPTASVLLGVDEASPSGADSGHGLAPDLLAAVAVALLEDLGRPTTRVAAVPMAQLCRPAGAQTVTGGTPGAAAAGALPGAAQWEIPTPPLVSAP